MATRLMTIAKELILKPKTGISEKESYFNVHFLNARNEVSEIQRILDIELNKAREISEAGRHYTRYTVKDGDQIQPLQRKTTLSARKTESLFRYSIFH